MSQHHALIKNDPRWKAARAACLARDGHACVECGAHADDLDKPLQADHIVRLSERPDLAFDLDNLQTLCTSCHEDKEREYERNRLIRRTWVNPAYPELIELIGIETPASTTPVF